LSLLSYDHRGGDEGLKFATISAVFNQAVKNFPDHEAVVSLSQQQRMTYGEMAGAVDELAWGLLELGNGPGDRIGIWAVNNIQWLLVQLACARIGGVLVYINPGYRTSELPHALKLAGVKTLFAMPSFRASNYLQILMGLFPDLGRGHELDEPDFPELEHIVIYDPDLTGPVNLPGPGFLGWNDVVAGSGQGPVREEDFMGEYIDPDLPANIQFTSGTTGAPKAVVLSHHNMVNNAYFAGRRMKLTKDDRLCVPVPYYHCFGTVLASILCIGCGACQVIACAHFDPGLVLGAICQERCTVIHGVPTMFIAELDHPGFKREQMKTLRTGIMAGAPCSPSLIKRVIEEMDCPDILIAYGETEASPLTHMTAASDSFFCRTQTVGRGLPHQETKVIDVGSGRVAQRGEVGEICFRGYHVMKGYYKNESATREAIDDAGWLHSGDLGVMDENGFVQITGRLKNMIIRGGENVFPREIEEYIYNHQQVGEVAVFGVEDDYWGEEVAAWIRLREGGRMSAEEVRDYCRQGLAHFKVPRHIRFVDQFPMTVTGKIQKFRMRQLMEDELKKGGRDED